MSVLAQVQVLVLVLVLVLTLAPVQVQVLQRMQVLRPSHRYRRHRAAAVQTRRPQYPKKRRKVWS